jgi:hypothetical protein
MSEPESHRGPDRNNLAAIAGLEPIVRDPAADFGHWEQPPPEPDGRLHMPYYVFGPAGRAFLGAVTESGAVLAGFDWPSWMATDEAIALQSRPEVLAAATPEQLARLLTAIVRSERFTEGSIAGAWESGLLGRVVARAASLTAAP